MSGAQSIAAARARVVLRLARARTLAIASDFDGTLTPIADHPRRTHMSPVARAALKRLARARDARVAIVSGRRVGDLSRHVRMRGIVLAGAGGLEFQDARGRRSWLVGAGARPPLALEGALAAWCARFRGAWIEDKQHAFAVHYRAVARARRAAFVAGARRRFARWPGAARVLHGKRVFEVLPPGDRDKGTALARWLGPPRAGTLAVYLGDDTNDEPAHALVRARKGVSIVVGRRPSIAEFRARSPAAAAKFLDWLADAWTARGAAVRRR